jgi:hypothetical protein
MLFKPVMTLEQIADVMGCTRERVRQIEESALRNARKILRKKGYNPDNFFSDPRYTKPIKPTEGEILSDSSEYELMYEKEELND